MQTYKTISSDIGQVAHGVTTLVGKGTVFIPVGKRVIQEAYHVTGVSSYISAAHLLPRHIEVIMSSSFQRDKGCHLLKKGSFTESDIIWQTACRDGLYVLNMDTNTVPLTQSFALHSRYDSYQELHEIPGHFSSAQYQKIANTRNEISSLSKSITDSLDCISCLTVKMKKSSNQSSSIILLTRTKRFTFASRVPS